MIYISEMNPHNFFPHTWFLHNLIFYSNRDKQINLLMLFPGWFGLILIVLFTMNAGFSGTRLGLCWMMLEERYEEFRGEVRDPYPAIGEKAVGRWGR